MEGITKFQIKYRLSELDIYKRTEVTLLQEGWNKTNYTEHTKRTQKFEVLTSWFERKWK